jgi:phospholipid N-methyltransferase
MRNWRLCGDFFRECRRQFHTTGSILPSSRFLARALVAELRRPRGPARILEVGPGTGSVTAAILRHLQPGDHFDAVEINAQFISLLARRLDQDEIFRRHRDQVHLIHAAVEDLVGDGAYDFIVSGLPLNNFSAIQVRRIFRTYDRLLKPGGTLTYYEYVLVRQIKTTLVNRHDRRRLLCLGHVVNSYIRAYQFHRQRILANVPPAVVRHLRFNSDGHALDQSPHQLLGMNPKQHMAAGRKSAASR